MTTKEIMDEFFSDKPEEYTRKLRGSVDRPELYAYEEKVGKQFYELSVDEAYELLKSFTPETRKEYDGNLRLSSYIGYVSMYRQICDNFFRKHPEEYKVTPYGDKRMKGDALITEVTSWTNPLTLTQLNNAIVAMHKQLSQDSANFNECIILLHLSGASSMDEIMHIHEEDIDFDNNIIHIGERDIAITDRLAYLLQYVHDMKIMEANKRNYGMMYWRGSYIPIPHSKNSEVSLDSRDIRDINKFMNVRYQNLRKITNVNITGRIVFELGLYMHLVEKFGLEQANQMILSDDTESSEALIKFAESYGVKFYWAHEIRRRLLGYARLGKDAL